MIPDGRQVAIRSLSPAMIDIGSFQNEDIDPVPVAARVWGTGSFASYWVSDMLAVRSLCGRVQPAAHRWCLLSLLCGRLFQQPCLLDSPLAKSSPVSTAASHPVVTFFLISFPR